MSGNTLTIFLYELKRNFRRPGYLLTTFGTPLLIFAIVTFMSRTAASVGGDLSNPETAQQLAEEFIPDASAKQGVIDHSGHFTTIPANLTNNVIPYATDAEARAALDAGEIQAYYVIAEDFMETADVTIVIPEFSISRLGEGNLNNLVLQTLSAEVDGDIEARLVNPANYTETNIALLAPAEDASAARGANFLIVYAFVMTLMITVFMTNGYLMQTLLEEKETRLIEILISTLRPIQLLTGKILALGMLGLGQAVAWVAAMILLVRIFGGEQASESLSVLATLAQIEFPVSLIPIMVIYFVLTYLLFAGFYSVLSAILNSMREGQQYTVLLILPFTVPLYVMPLIATQPDGGLAVALSIFPLTSPLAMIARLVSSTVPPAEILISVVLLALMVVAVIWLAARIFRVGILLAGQSPKLRDIPKLLRG